MTSLSSSFCAQDSLKLFILLLGLLAIPLLFVNHGQAKPKQTANTGAKSQSKTPVDPFLWLEEIEGEKALNWVKEKNKETS